MRLKKDLARLVQLERVCHVATAGKSGVPHVVPVCPVLADGKAYFASGGGAKKVELNGVMIQDPVELIERGPRFTKLRDLPCEKYPQYAEDAALGKGDVIVEITPRHVFSREMDS